MKERLIPVTSESQLKPGAVCVVSPCSTCGVPHRYMMLSQQSAPTPCFICAAGECRGWDRAPRPKCAFVGGTGILCVRRMVSEGRLYIVDPFSEQETQQHTRKKQPVGSHAR